ncbi:hypothetical protein B0H17DRAFT_1149149 [Mycena rosella]|uniref:Secreted protein n=1 Tax=Mycena rosella TaxID=1033263 RepID=A0AAD7C658_MYCRO|nr:hypothetical protein B0H17DRAFT_1149149 [Mycena rosella]
MFAFITKSLAAAMFVGAARPLAFNGTAILGFDGVTICGSPATNGPLLVAIPPTLPASTAAAKTRSPSHVRRAASRTCILTLRFSNNDRSIVAIFSGMHDEARERRTWRSAP